MRTDSVASGRSNKNTYRVRSRTSDVDETLFSSPTKDSLIKRQQAPRARETVTVITKDLIRNVIVPSKDPSGQSVVLQRNSFNRIKHASKVRSKLDIEQEAKNRQQKKGTYVHLFNINFLNVSSQLVGSKQLTPRSLGVTFILSQAGILNEKSCSIFVKI